MLRCVCVSISHTDKTLLSSILAWPFRLSFLSICHASSKIINLTKVYKNCKLIITVSRTSLLWWIFKRALAMNLAREINGASQIGVKVQEERMNIIIKHKVLIIQQRTKVLINKCLQLKVTFLITNLFKHIFCIPLIF